MRCLDLTLPSAAENLALDEALLLDAEEGQGGEVLRLWEWPRRAVVLGSGCKLAEDVELSACRDDEVPVLRRSSGGGTVLLGTGCLCFSLVLAYRRDEALAEVRSSYRYILGRVIEGFGLEGLGLEGISDLAMQGRKCSGNAQQRKRLHLLHHGTILYDFALADLGRYLRQPARQPEYRAGRVHEAFVCNLERPRDWLVERLKVTWSAEGENGWPRERVEKLVEEKYARTSWTERR